MNLNNFYCKNRVKTKKDIDNIYKNGNLFKGHFYNIKYLKNNLHFNRIGIVIKKKIAMQ